MSEYAKNKFWLYIIFALFVGLVSCSNVAPWYTDFDEALEVAKRYDKDMFVVFTGLEWDTDSKRLKTEIFDRSEFLGFTAKQYVLVRLELPFKNVEIPEEYGAKNYEIAQRYGVHASPSIVLLTKTGQAFSRVQLFTDTKTVDDMIALLKTYEGTRKKIDKIYKKMEKAEGFARVSLINDYVDAIPIEFRGTLSPYFDEIIRSDPENKSGFLGKYKLEKAYELSRRDFSSGDMIAAANRFFSLLNEKGLLDDLQTQKAYYTAAYFSTQSRKVPVDQIIGYLKKAYDAAPNSSVAPDIFSIMESLGSVNMIKP